jgi:hypothetical protein
MSLPASCDQESRLRKLLELVGLPSDSVRFARCGNGDDTLSIVHSRDRRPLVVELAYGLAAESLGALDEISQCGAAQPEIFLFGPAASSSCAHHTPLHATPAYRHKNSTSEIRFSDDTLLGPLQGLRANWQVSQESSSLKLFKPSGCWHPLITIGDEPWFLRSSSDGATKFLWEATHLPDISEPLSANDESQAGSLLQLLPVLVFLRKAFGNRTWHAPKCFANFIIDDPPVRDRYGFFSPARYLAALAEIPHATTVAFIPWNRHRSTARAAEFFRSHRSHLSLCVHGCDHTGGEFASFNRTVLSGKCRLALQRTEVLRQLTGLSCDPVMVFPQGLFSKAAVAALRENEFLAAVNSTLFPTDAQAGEFSVADLIEPAYASLEDFPIFLRRYPRDPVQCAIDIFLGRPLLLVEHHDYFRHGYAECRRFLEAMNSLRCCISWERLDHIVQRVCLRREIEPGSFEVRFYTNSFVLENTSAERFSYRLARRWSRPDLLRLVVANGSPVPHIFEDGQVRFSLELHPRTSATIQLVQSGPVKTEVFQSSLSYRARVWARRRLCDLRDNHAWISLCAEWAKRVR